MVHVDRYTSHDLPWLNARQIAAKTITKGQQPLRKGNYINIPNTTLAM
ncbi:hypothetical protein SAMN02745781_01494, partial [Vibrio gazogenes DSM 21264]